MTDKKCANCGHPIWLSIIDNSASHKGNTTGDMCFVDGCGCDNPRQIIKKEAGK